MLTSSRAILKCRLVKDDVSIAVETLPEDIQKFLKNVELDKIRSIDLTENREAVIRESANAKNKFFTHEGKQYILVKNLPVSKCYRPVTNGKKTSIKSFIENQVYKNLKRIHKTQNRTP